ncbi:hypothetical protein D3C80_2032840 [compost metagenome]
MVHLVTRHNHTAEVFFLRKRTERNLVKGVSRDDPQMALANSKTPDIPHMRNNEIIIEIQRLNPFLRLGTRNHNT